MTNAHVVAGVTRPQVEVDGRAAAGDRGALRLGPGRRGAAGARARAAGAAASPPRRPTPTTTRSWSATRRTAPFFVGPARIRDRLQIRGPDIYDDRTVTREVYSIFGDVRSGNSGGPLLAPNGSVYGVIFAAAIDQQQTGFVLTAAEVADDARAGRTATEAVSTGDCA